MRDDDVPGAAAGPRARRHLGHRSRDRVGEPEDIAGAILALLRNPFATGSIVRVDGGAMLA